MRAWQPVTTHGTDVTLRVNPISRIHSEADVVKSMARQVAIKRLTVYTPPENA